jgi:hypothetical protein
LSRANAHAQNYGEFKAALDRLAERTADASRGLDASTAALSKVSADVAEMESGIDEHARSRVCANLANLPDEVQYAISKLHIYLNFAENVYPSTDIRRIVSEMGIGDAEAANSFGDRLELLRREIEIILPLLDLDDERLRAWTEREPERGSFSWQLVRPDEIDHVKESLAWLASAEGQCDTLITDIALINLDKRGLLEDETAAADLKLAIERDPKKLLALIHYPDAAQEFLAGVAERIDAALKSYVDVNEEAAQASRDLSEIHVIHDMDLRTTRDLQAALTPILPALNDFLGYWQYAVHESGNYPQVLCDSRDEMRDKTAKALEALQLGRTTICDSCHLGSHRERQVEAVRSLSPQFTKISDDGVEARRLLSPANDSLQSFEEINADVIALREQQILRAEEVRQHPGRFPAIVTQFGTREPRNPVQREVWNDAIGRSAFLGAMIGYGNTTLFNVPRFKDPKHERFFEHQIARLREDAKFLGVAPRILPSPPDLTVGINAA